MTAIDPTLGRVPRVLVPIQVDALVLAEATGGFADCRMKSPDPAGGRQDLLPPPFADQAAPRPKGVHLHWALPDALTHTWPTADEPTDGTAPQADLPAIPDRWLVVRLSRGTTPDKRAWRAWVIESSGPVPVVRPLPTWQDSGTLPFPGQEPTAFGPGDLAWSAYYDNVVGRLGFHDPLDDGAQGPLAYLVSGWYANPALDPLADPAITSLSAFHQRMADLGWSLPGRELEQDVLAAPFSFDITAAPGTPDANALAALAATAGGAGPTVTRGPLVTDGSWWPRGLMAHGSVVALGWPTPGWPDAEAGLLGVGAEQTGPPDPADTRVAFGSTLSEALGALMVGFLAAAQGLPEDEVLSEDRMLEAFQIGLLSEIDHPDGRARLDARLHADGFRALAADQRTVVAPAGEPDPNGDDDAGDGPGTVERSQPRWFAPGEPAVVVQGLRRSLKHGGDGRFTPDGTLVCRLSGFTVTALSAQLGEGTQRALVQPGALLESPFAHPSLPPDCFDLLGETVLLDPGSARAASLTTLPPLGGPDTQTVDELTRNFMVEQTVWWALRDPLVNPEALLLRSGIAGSLPSPLAVTPPTAVWAPRHLDWEVEVFPTPGGLAEWQLGELDYGPRTGPGPSDDVFDNDAPGTGVVLRGRSLLTGGVAQRTAQAGQAAIELVAVSGSTVLGGDPSHIFVPAAPDGGGVSSGTQTVAQAFVAALRNMDVMAATLDGVHARLRDEPTGQWVGSDAPPPLDPDPHAPGLIAGSMRPTRLRLVDTFGQVVDLLGSGPDEPAAAAEALTSRPTTVPDHPGLVALTPRFAAPSRLMFRFVDAGDLANAVPTTPLEDADESVRPVAGFLLPDHLDGALEVFDASGTALGQLLPALDGTGRAVWEVAPGRPTGAGDLPSDVIADPALGAVADGLVRWGDHDGTTSQDESEGALSALLRMIDSTLWTTDPFGHTGDEHGALLTGHPIVVLRAVLRLDVDDPLDPDDVYTTPVPVRLGALAHWQDGLLGFYVGDAVDHVRSTGAAASAMARPVGPGQGYLGPAAQIGAFHQSFAADVAPGQSPATPVTHPYVVDDPVVRVWPGVEVPVTLLVVPHAVVHATSGLVPRKDLGMRRQWVADGLSRLAPAFRFGPVLVDPRSIRMPVAADLAGTWTWNHRADVATWSDDPVVNATDDALMSAKVAVAEEGWLTLHPLTEAVDR
jgi:hypothetical protein